MARIKGVVIEGFLLSAHSPTEARISVNCDCSHLSWGDYREVIYSLQDVLAEVDEAFKRRSLRGRGLRARHRRITARRRSKVIDFQPFPSRYVNVLRSLRRGLYELINENCIVLQMMEYGAFRRNIYLLPYSRAPRFMSRVAILNEIIKELNVDVQRFMKSEYYQRIRNIFRRFNVDDSEFDRIGEIPEIEVDLTPLRLDPSIVEGLIESRYKKMFKKIREEERIGLEKIRMELERKRSEMVSKAIQDLQGRLSTLIGNIAKYSVTKFTPRRAEGARRVLMDIKELAEGTGVGAFIGEAVEATLKLIDATATNDVEGVKDAVDEIAEFAGVEVKDDPIETLKEVSVSLTKGVSERVKALMREML